MIRILDWIGKFLPVFVVLRRDDRSPHRRLNPLAPGLGRDLHAMTEIVSPTGHALSGLAILLHPIVEIQYHAESLRPDHLPREAYRELVFLMPYPPRARSIAPK